MQDYSRDVLALDDTKLELFVRDWADNKQSKYFEVARFSGSGDLGRDVVGFHTAAKHEGSWDNYQCKQYGKRLPTDTAICELGKILYYASQGEFTPPTMYYFVAPKGLNRNLEHLVFNPSKLKNMLIKDWDKYCRYKIVDGGDIPLKGEVLKMVQDFDYSVVRRVALEDILSDESAKKVLYKVFGADPGSSPKGIVPQDILDIESEYIKQLIDAYSEQENAAFAHHGEISAHPHLLQNLELQRERFFDADAFKRYYRDNTDPSVIDLVEQDVYHGIADVLSEKHSSTMKKITAVMKQAATVQPSGIALKYARVPVKQGVCHHFDNDGKFKWKK